ncbi:unnamed protein product [Symbiodinium microadriaticum]|nr:unnamed protein product [Symbiodinium microadriaticum]
MTSRRQVLFLNRIFALHDRATRRRTSKSQSVRLALSHWEKEVNAICALDYVLGMMRLARDANNSPIFEDKLLDSVKQKILDGDYHEEVTTHIEACNPLFKAEHALLWQDHAPALAKAAEAKAEKLLGSMSDEASRIAWETATLKLASDVSSITRLLEAEMQTQRSRHLSRVSHLKTQILFFNRVSTLGLMASGGLRGDMRRIEDKFEAKHMSLVFLTLRMGHEDSNIFSNSQLLMDRGNRQMLPWAPERSYIVPVGGKDQPPSTAEGDKRALSDVQEAAQLLAGAQFPESILDACTRGMSGDMILPSEKLHLLNLTPYDAFLEKVCLKYHLQVAQEARSKPNPQVAVLSCTTDVDTGMYVQQVMGLTTMEEWKKTSKLFENETCKFQQEPPTDVPSPDLANYNFKLVEVTVNPQKHGSKRFNFNLPASARALYANDIVHGPEWINLIKQFDEQPLAAESCLGAPQMHQRPLSMFVGYLHMRHVLDSITSQHTMPGASLFVTKAVTKEGKSECMTDDQPFKLWIVHPLKTLQDFIKKARLVYLVTVPPRAAAGSSKDLPLTSAMGSSPEMKLEVRRDLSEALAGALQNAQKEAGSDSDDEDGNKKTKKNKSKNKAPKQEKQANGDTAPKAQAEAGQAAEPAPAEAPATGSEGAKAAPQSAEAAGVPAKDKSGGSPTKLKEMMKTLAASRLSADGANATAKATPKGKAKSKTSKSKDDVAAEDNAVDEGLGKKKAGAKALSSYSYHHHVNILPDVHIRHPWRQAADKKKKAKSQNPEATPEGDDEAKPKTLQQEFFKFQKEKTNQLKSEHPEKTVREIFAMVHQEWKTNPIRTAAIANMTESRRKKGTSNLMVCQWTRDSDSLVMEIPSEFKVAPKAQKLWYQYTMVPRTNIGAQKFGMLASAFPVKVLEASPILRRCWRVAMATELNET